MTLSNFSLLGFLGNRSFGPFLVCTGFRIHSGLGGHSYRLCIPSSLDIPFSPGESARQRQPHHSEHSCAKRSACSAGHLGSKASLAGSAPSPRAARSTEGWWLLRRNWDRTGGGCRCQRSRDRILTCESVGLCHVLVLVSYVF